MKLILVRHGETDSNVQEVVQGQLPVPLNSKGLEQARKVGLRLKAEKIDVIYSSDLERAKQTTAEIARFHKIPLIYSVLLRERKFGKLEGMPSSEYKKLRDSSGLQRHLYRPPRGESYSDIDKRVKRFLSMIRKKHENQNVLIVSHGGVIRIFVALLTKRPLEKIFDLEMHRNTAVSVIELTRGSPPKIHYLNSTEHL